MSIVPNRIKYIGRPSKKIETSMLDFKETSWICLVMRYAVIYYIRTEKGKWTNLCHIYAIHRDNTLLLQTGDSMFGELCPRDAGASNEECCGAFQMPVKYNKII